MYTLLERIHGLSVLYGCCGRSLPQTRCEINTCDVLCCRLCVVHTSLVAFNRTRQHMLLFSLYYSYVQLPVHREIGVTACHPSVLEGGSQLWVSIICVPLWDSARTKLSTRPPLVYLLPGSGGIRIVLYDPKTKVAKQELYTSISIYWTFLKQLGALPLWTPDLCDLQVLARWIQGTDTLCSAKGPDRLQIFILHNWLIQFVAVMKMEACNWLSNKGTWYRIRQLCIYTTSTLTAVRSSGKLHSAMQLTDTLHEAKEDWKWSLAALANLKTNFGLKQDWNCRLCFNYVLINPF